MKEWISLGLAILFEVMATASLKSTEGFTKLWPSLLVVAGYTGAFYFVSLTLDVIPVAVVYAIWSGLGMALLVLVSYIFLGQTLDKASLMGIGLIIVGVVVIHYYGEPLTTS